MQSTVAANGTDGEQRSGRIGKPDVVVGRRFARWARQT
jgi:hypothetical protein